MHMDFLFQMNSSNNKIIIFSDLTFLCFFPLCSLNILDHQAPKYKYYLNKNFDLFSSLLILSTHQQAWGLYENTEL